MIKRLSIALAILAGTLLILVLYLPGQRPKPTTTTTVSGVAAIGGPFTLVDTKGRTVTEAALQGRYSLVYFGYTYCPDICPLALQNMTRALEMAGPVAEDVLPVLITIDPERDTPEVLASYMTHFSPRFLALTGTPEQVQAAEHSYRVYAAKSQTKDNRGDDGSSYLMDHSGYIYLMDRAGLYVANFQKDATAADIATRLRKELNPS